MTTKTNQTVTLVQAKNWGETWTSADLELLAACPDIPAVELALALGRSLYAINLARQNLERTPAEPRAARVGAGRVKGGHRWSSDLSLYEL